MDLPATRRLPVCVAKETLDVCCLIGGIVLRSLNTDVSLLVVSPVCIGSKRSRTRLSDLSDDTSLNGNEARISAVVSTRNSSGA